MKVSDFSTQYLQKNSKKLKTRELYERRFIEKKMKGNYSIDFIGSFHKWLEKLLFSIYMGKYK